MDDLVRIKIDDRIYTVQKFNPYDGMEFALKALSILSVSIGGIYELVKEKGNASKLGKEISEALKDKDMMPIIRQTMAQCFNNENESLADESIFNKHFRAYPQDLFELAGKAIYALIKDFLPRQITLTQADLQAYLKKMNLPTS